MLFKLGEKVSDENILKMLQDLDKDKDGAIGYEDLVQAIY